VIRTRVGYAGGTEKNPSYHALGDHTETIQMDYDPAVISYEKLLEVFWNSHDPTVSEPRQYMSLIFYHNEAQKKAAFKSKILEEARIKNPLVTEIRPAGAFYLAEDYHQKYGLRMERSLVKEFSVMYPAKEGFVNSTAAARINGYLDGYGSLADLQGDLPGLGLSRVARDRLIRVVSQRPGRVGCKL
jgi:peptide-methionine (S)-S-oxide reductase